MVMGYAETVEGERSLRCWWKGHNWQSASRPFWTECTGKICTWCGRQEWEAQIIKIRGRD